MSKISYYDDNTRISNSNIGMYIKYGIKYLKGYLDGTIEGIKGKSLDKGTMIHAWILQQDEFWKLYEILDFEVPKSKQMKEFCEYWFELNTELDETERKLKAYRKAYNNKKSEKDILIETDTILSEYDKYIQSIELKSVKDIMSFSDLTSLKTIESNIKNHKKANELMYDLPNTFEEYNELHINWDYPTTKETITKCKSLLDRLLIDHTNKKIILIDLKTTADLQNFSKSVKDYDYLRQLSFYWMAIHWYFKNELNLNIEEYQVETYIVAIKNHDDYGVRVFSINPDKIENKLEVIHDSIVDIQWHIDNNKWDHSKNYYLSDGIEQLSYEN